MTPVSSTYLEKLIANCKKAQEASPVNSYICHDPLDLEILGSTKIGIYIISEIGGDPNATYEKFKTFKALKERACAKLNKPSQTLYVGSSTTGILKRLKQHVGDGHVGTYALHLSQWFVGKYQIEILEYDLEIDVLQLVEDSISYNLNPAFGKQGGNNK